MLAGVRIRGYLPNATVRGAGQTGLNNITVTELLRSWDSLQCSVSDPSHRASPALTITSYAQTLCLPNIGLAAAYTEPSFLVAGSIRRYVFEHDARGLKEKRSIVVSKAQGPKAMDTASQPD